MGYRLGDKEIKLNGKRMTKIGTGKTGDVYRYRNMALKIFKNNNFSIDKDTADYLTNINTHRILLPKNLLFYNHAFKGYSYKLINKSKRTNNIISLNKEELIENILLLERDIELLSNKRVLLNGIEPSNTIFNGRLYITDPSEYGILDIYSTHDLESLNKYQLHLLLTSLITGDIRRNNFGSDVERYIKKILEDKDTYQDSSEYIDEVLYTDNSIIEYVKKYKYRGD